MDRLTSLDQIGQALERNILLAVGVIEFSVGVFFDCVHHVGPPRTRLAHYSTPCHTPPDRHIDACGPVALPKAITSPFRSVCAVSDSAQVPVREPSFPASATWHSISTQDIDEEEICDDQSSRRSWGCCLV